MKTFILDSVSFGFGGDSIFSEERALFGISFFSFSSWISCFDVEEIICIYVKLKMFLQVLLFVFMIFYIIYNYGNMSVMLKLIHLRIINGVKTTGIGNS